MCYDEAEEDEGDGGDEDNANDDHVNDDDFDEPDPDATTERLSIGCPSLPTDFVVVLHGFSFKPKVRLNTKEKRERNALAVLLCFVPFDSLEKLHILQGCESYTEAAEKADICPLGIKYLKNVELLWTDKMKAQERTKTHNQALLTEAEKTEGLQGLSFCKKTMNSLDSDDDFNSDSDNDLDTGDNDGMHISSSASMFSPGGASEMDVSWVESTASSFGSAPKLLGLPKIKPQVIAASITGYSSMLSGISKVGLPISASKVNANTPAENDNDSDFDDDDDDDDTRDSDSGVGPTSTRTIRPLTVEEISENVDASCADCIFGSEPLQSFKRAIPVDIPAYVSVCVQVGKSLQELPTCATINEVSRLFGYNKNQHLAFAIGARSFLQLLAREASQDDMPDAEIAELQRLVEIHGMGGTGKSHVINGWIALSVSWSRPHAVGTFAITGVAAINISGQTFARLVYSFSKFGMSESKRRKYRSKRMFILDEVSMVKCIDLSVLDSFLRALTGRSNLAFGGVILILAGDFFQLPPVGGNYLYVNPGGNSAAKIGFELYRSVTDIVVLTEVYFVPQLLLHTSLR